ncbi:MAG TPA: GNAT family protein, partial [Reyranella sp.]|nr:GNAT family protein [Reyranella sp.]
MFPERLETARLMLRPIAPSDAAAIFDGYAQDPEVTRFLTWRPHVAITETEAHIARCRVEAQSKTYVLVGKRDGKIIGSFALRHPALHRLGYGYVLARPFWGMGLMTEVLSHATQWALDQGDIWRIGDVCDCENIGSARVMEKVGLEREGLLRRWIMHPNVSNEPRDCFAYARSR